MPARKTRARQRPRSAAAGAAGAGGAVVGGVVDVIVPGGEALLRTESHGVVFTRGALPGERVDVRLHPEKRAGVHRGELLRVIEASRHRVPPDCPLHPRCGGCDLLDLAPAAALQVRERIVRDALLRIGKLERDVVERAVRPIIAAGERDDARRRRARFVVVDGKLTFSVAAGHERIAVDRCLALHPTLDAALARIAAVRLPERAGVRIACDERGRVSAAFDDVDPKRASTFVDAAARLVDAGAVDGVVVVAGHEADSDDVTRESGTRDHELGRAGDPVLLGEVAPGYEPHCASDAAVFTQATRFGGRAIIEAVLAAARVTTSTRVLELFAGSGHITVPLLAAGAAHVVAIEGAARSVRYLELNTARFRDGGHRVQAVRAFIDGTLAATAPEPGGRFDVVVADPPRAGIAGISGLLSLLQPAQLVLVSCDVATGARDIALALGAGYALESVQPIDAFPRTSHVEWVASLSRR